MPNELIKRITVRVSPHAYERLAAIARETQRTVSDVVRHALERRPIRGRRRERRNTDLVRQLIRVGNNLNQLTRLLHLLKHRGDLPDAQALLATLEKVQATLQSVSSEIRSYPSLDDQPDLPQKQPERRTSP